MLDSSLGEPYNRYAAVARLMQKTFSQPCINAQYKSYIQDMSNTSWSGPEAGGGASVSLFMCSMTVLVSHTVFIFVCDVPRLFSSLGSAVWASHLSFPMFLWVLPLISFCNLHPWVRANILICDFNRWILWKYAQEIIFSMKMKPIKFIYILYFVYLILLQYNASFMTSFGTL